MNRFPAADHPAPRRACPARTADQRGQALSVFVLVVMAALILVAGLVVDGGQKARAVSRAESIAAGAARAGANAGAAGTLAGGTLAGGAASGVDVTVVRSAAEDYLAGAALGSGPAIRGSVSVRGDQVLVRTTTTVPTIFLSVIGIDELTATGEASARVVSA